MITHLLGFWDDISASNLCNLEGFAAPNADAIFVAKWFLSAEYMKSTLQCWDRSWPSCSLKNRAHVLAQRQSWNPPLLSWYFWPMKSTVGLALCARQRDAPTGDIGRTT